VSLSREGSVLPNILLGTLIMAVVQRSFAKLLEQALGESLGDSLPD
jgi:hypothetical protein